MLTYQPYQPYLGPVRLAPELSGISRRAKPVHLSATEDVGLGIVVPGIIVIASTAASAYHGYKRNNSTGWAIWWGLMGAIFPIITPAIAVAQGFGKRSRK